MINTYEDYLAYINPQSMLSATYPSCLEKAKDALCGGGVTNGSGISFGFLGDLADSMVMIKKYVFDRKEFTLAELVEMLDANFEGYEPVRRKLLADHDKYGNNKELPDSFVTDITGFLSKYVCGRPNAKKTRR